MIMRRSGLHLCCAILALCIVPFLGGCGLTSGPTNSYTPVVSTSTPTGINGIVLKADTVLVAACTKANAAQPFVVPLADAVATAVDPSTGVVLVTAIDAAGQAACASANAVYQGYQLQAAAAAATPAVTPAIATTPPAASP